MNEPKVHAAQEQHEQMYQELTGVIRKYTDKMSGAEVLAILSVICGQALALQDQRTMTPERGMKLILANIEAGNQRVLAQLAAVSGPKQ